MLEYVDRVQGHYVANHTYHAFFQESHGGHMRGMVNASEMTSCPSNHDERFAYFENLLRKQNNGPKRSLTDEEVARLKTQADSFESEIEVRNEPRATPIRGFSFPLLSFPLLSFALLCFALLCLALIALLCFALLYFALLACFALLCFVLLCLALLCFALLCFAMLCFALNLEGKLAHVTVALLCFALLCFAPRERERERERESWHMLRLLCFALLCFALLCFALF